MEYETPLLALSGYELPSFRMRFPQQWSYYCRYRGPPTIYHSPIVPTTAIGQLSQQNLTVDELLLTRAKANGYQRGVYPVLGAIRYGMRTQ